MRSWVKTAILLAVAIGILGGVSCSSPGGVSGAALERGFADPPDSIQTSVYWYWISGNVSKEGVEKDLESMKQVGIDRAFIGNIGLSEAEAPAGPVKVLSEEWWEIIHAALRKAGELGIDIGLFNCPGWSQSGGPWIEPGQSMRYLASAEHRVAGGRKIEMRLDKPSADFQDVKMLAYPDLLAASPLPSASAKVSSIPHLPGAARWVDGDRDSGSGFGEHTRVTLDIAFPETVTIRSLRLQTIHKPTRANVEFLVKEGGNYRSVRTFTVNRTRDKTDVGFDPYAPVVVTVPDLSAREFRITLSDLNRDGGLQEIELSDRPAIEQYPEKTLAKMHQTPLPYWKEYQWTRQPEPGDPGVILQPDKVLDLSAFRTGDDLVWDAPDGNWIIVRYGMRPTGERNGPAAPEGKGPEVDKMTEAFLPHHFDSFIGRVLDRIPAEDRKTFKVVVSDSYEKGGQNFTDTFFEDFKARYGYDALPFLPVYHGEVVGSRDRSDRFLWDLRRMVADRLAYQHIGGMRKLAHEHGLTLWLENYGHWGFPGEFLQYGGQSDEVAGEFWSEGTLGDIENRAASSAAHIYGKNKVSAESFTAGGKAYSRYPAVMKPRGDRFFAEGINNTLLHVYISKAVDGPQPGLNAPFGNEFDRNNTWFPQLDLFITYLKRVNFMLQQGVNVADVCYFIGEDTPKMTGVTDPALPHGYQFDYINAEVILRDLTVRDGLLTLPHGTQYKLLVLPKLETMRPELLEKIRQLVAEGGVILGPRPERSPSLENYPEADTRVKSLAAELWGNNEGPVPQNRDYGKGKVLTGMDMPEALAATGCRADCSVPSEIHFGHRDLGNMQVYFLSNQSGERMVFPAEFRVGGKQPEAWDAVSGAVRRLPAWKDRGESTVVPLALEPYESTFIVFRGKAGKPAGSDVGLNYPKPETVAEIDTPWHLAFDPAFRGPSTPVTMAALQDLSLSPRDSIRYYSGKVVYENSFEMPEPEKGNNYFLHTGEVGVMAKVYVNGQYAGGVWTHPYRVDISEWVKPGTNTLRIETVNTWVNRLIGDRSLPDGKQETWTPNNPWRADSPLQKSGLSGPVRIEAVRY